MSEPRSDLGEQIKFIRGLADLPRDQVVSIEFRAGDLAAALTRKSEILPGAVYEVAEVAAILGLQRVDSVYQIPEDELVPTRVGPRRGKKVFMGADIIDYLRRGRAKPIYRRRDSFEIDGAGRS